MEASETPQFPLDGDAAGVVRALDDRLVIEQLTVEDERAARIVRERAEAGQAATATVAKAIEIGARVLDSEETAANVDYVRAELERNVGRLGKDLQETMSAGEQALVERISAAFGAERSDSVQQQIKEIVRGANEEARVAITRVFTAQDGTNPLTAAVKAVNDADQRHREEMARLRQSYETEQRAMREQFSALHEQITKGTEREEADRRVAEAEEAGTRKGRTFEEGVHEAIERIAAIRGDAATHTGGVQAEGGGKKGDTLVELAAAEGPSCGRVLFEAKDKKLSRNDAWAQLNAGMSARAAAFGVLVVAGDEHVPSGCDTLNEYAGDKMIVAVDRDQPDGLALEVAYRLAAARVAMAREGELEVDAAAVRDTAEEAVSTLKQAQAIRSALTGIKTSSDKARGNLDAMVEAVRAKLERIESLVAESE
jgi:hypothetical protein